MSNASAGVSLERYEYQRYQLGALPYWTPLRFPGQYHDAETDLFENWNRFYDPSVGRYLRPEPLLQSPRYVRAMAKMGHSVPAYAYALNNPLHFVDETGLGPKDKLYGLAKDFWNWYHRKVKRPGDPELSKEEAEALHEEWKQLGKPGPDSKKDWKSLIPAVGLEDIVDLLLPDIQSPSELACSTLDCDNDRNGIPDRWEREKTCR